MFPQNEGALDRVIRLVLGIGVGVAVFTALTGVWQIVAAIVAAILLLTAAIGFCPIYAVFRMSTHHEVLSGSV
ncbi:MAG TPA: DUF2892 domain-containing protein [Ktedonobacterales bacterium]